ncbi:YidC/Oxa1 family membrane protein insertase [Fuchsiella alkaliacetigena]|uniref:YidC/Oxa1 family membrane protein insertase n=1 Tax=Fuchsiella alkaliacetigena TaxID=957042 RepID=UPI00200B1BE0|nr:YidC/Oxa1 family membrane protein insertase [Fuchsiella alkaliacetigena]MCK8824530.1 YidC/Oxa1 family membrane protein insertase [Fuchsiella alkaliacetigena]
MNLISLGILGVFGDFFGWLGNLMTQSLDFFYGFTNSYGLAIILLTIIIKIILFPLISKQTRSMKAMQKLQPEMNKLKEKYEDEPKKYQEKVMELYKKNKVNPAAGCLPLLIQMPILLALFRALQEFPALEGVDFLWIANLAEPDFILVILTGLVMLGQSTLQRKMSGSDSGNKIMLFMPLFIVAIGSRLPAGVLVYWFTSNLLMVLQQYIIYREPITIKGESS